MDSKTPFEESVKHYSANDNDDIEKKRRSSLFRSLLLRSLLIALCIGLFGYSLYMIGSTIIDNYQSENKYAEIRADETDERDLVARTSEMAEPNNMPTVMDFLNADGEYNEYVEEEYKESSANTGARYRRIHKNFLAQSEKYEDMYAWIYMTDTSINYPVMKSDNNSYYMTHNFKGEEYRAGSIMADYRTGDDFYSNRNIIIYGHDMRNGSMFRSLRNWCLNSSSKKKMSSSQIEIYTKEGVYIYKVLAFYVDNRFEYSKPYFSSKDDFLGYIDKITSKSTVKANQSFDENSHICTLVTCTNGVDADARHIVHGIMTNFYPLQ